MIWSPQKFSLSKSTLIMLLLLKLSTTFICDRCIVFVAEQTKNLFYLDILIGN